MDILQDEISESDLGNVRNSDEIGTQNSDEV